MYVGLTSPSILTALCLLWKTLQDLFSKRGRLEEEAILSSFPENFVVGYLAEGLGDSRGPLPSSSYRIKPTEAQTKQGVEICPTAPGQDWWDTISFSFTLTCELCQEEQNSSCLVGEKQTCHLQGQDEWVQPSGWYYRLTPATRTPASAPRRVSELLQEMLIDCKASELFPANWGLWSTEADGTTSRFRMRGNGLKLC